MPRHTTHKCDDWCPGTPHTNVTTGARALHTQMCQLVPGHSTHKCVDWCQGTPHTNVTAGAWAHLTQASTGAWAHHTQMCQLVPGYTTHKCVYWCLGSPHANVSTGPWPHHTQMYNQVFSILYTSLQPVRHGLGGKKNTLILLVATVTSHTATTTSHVSCVLRCKAVHLNHTWPSAYGIT